MRNGLRFCDCQVDSCGEDPKAGVGIKGRAERGTTAQVIQIQRKEAGRNKFMCVLGANEPESDLGYDLVTRI